MIAAASKKLVKGLGNELTGISKNLPNPPFGYAQGMLFQREGVLLLRKGIGSDFVWQQEPRLDS